jgi:oligopeptide/dipeptide ABC transporter ATP-binding protein
MIAMALSCNPKLLIADEPTTALDVTIQAQIMDLMLKLRKNFDMAVMLITHDLGLIAEVVDRVVVMYCGRILESGGVDRIFQNPAHPYTLGLMGSIPQLDEDRERLQTIDGAVPSPFDMPVGCKFAPRCAFVTDICKKKDPESVEVETGHWVRCWRREHIVR